MKKSVKKIISGFIITAVTLIAGFGITMVSFNLFDTLTANQMKILFAIDVLSLAAAASGVWYFFESKKAEKNRKKAFEKRHNERMEQREKELKEINNLISYSDFAA